MPEVAPFSLTRFGQGGGGRNSTSPENEFCLTTTNSFSFSETSSARRIISNNFSGYIHEPEISFHYIIAYLILVYLHEEHSIFLGNARGKAD